MCLPSNRRTNFELIASTAARASTVGKDALSSRHSEKAVISGLSGSNGAPEIVRPHSHCVASALAIINAMLAGAWSKPSMATP